jgi:UDP-arabinose 4-epimerase
MSGNVLVTGGAGYVGSHACKALAKAGYVPVTYDNLARGHQWAVRWGPLEHGELADRARLNEVIRRYKPIAVLHFAAFAYVAESVEQPDRYYSNNVGGTLALLECMLANDLRCIVFSSTCSTYGVPRVVPIPDDHPQDPVNPYGASKLMVERMLRDYGHAHGMRYMALRYFNAAGADPDAEIGEVHEPETHLIPLALYAATGRRGALVIHGSDYPTPDGTCIRDYVHVTDLADGHVLALRYLVDDRPSCGMNLGTGRGHSVNEVVETVRRVTGRSFKVDIGPRRPGDPAELVAASGRASEALGWIPRYPQIDQVVSHAWAWMHKAASAGHLEQAERRRGA